MREKNKKSPLSHSKGENSDFRRELKRGISNFFKRFCFPFKIHKSQAVLLLPQSLMQDGLMLLCQYLKQEEEIST